MPRSEAIARADAGPDRGTKVGFDWRSWLALGWAVVFGALYARMVLRERAPGLWEAIRSALGVD